MLSTADDSHWWYLPHMEEIQCSESYLVHFANSARYERKMRTKIHPCIVSLLSYGL
jgi:hypothetical protein